MDPYGQSYPLPKTREQLVTFKIMPRDHATYAGIWATLSVSITYLAARALRKGR